MSNRDAVDASVVACVALVGGLIGAGCVTSAERDDGVGAGGSLQGQGVNVTAGVTLQGQDARAIDRLANKGRDDGAVARAAIGGPAEADDAGRRPPHCVVPWGIDWSEVLHVKKAAVVSPDCTEVRAGDAYTPEVLWITNTEDGIEGGLVLYPPGYTPRHKAPMNDFLHKLDRVRYVVQPGNQERSFDPSPIQRGLHVGDLYEGSGQFTEVQMVWPATALLGELSPLPPGSYSADIHFIMSDTHCDGQTDDFAKSCLPPGDSLALTRTFVVQP